MDWSSSSKNWGTRVGAVALAFALGASASAGTLYSWKTEDGTFAYTDDKKRIPARYKDEAQTAKLESMQSYARFTPGPKSDGKAHGERIVERLEVLRGMSAGAATSGGAGRTAADAYVKLDVGRGGDGGSDSHIEIPVGTGMEDAEPVVMEYVRMKPTAGRSTTRHFRVVKQGDRILAVIKDQIHDQRPTGLNEEDFDSNPLE